MEEKSCSRCKQSFPLTDQYWYVKKILKDSTQGKKLGLKKDFKGFRHICKKCNTACATERSRKKRCKELGCTEADYKETYMKQIRKSMRKYDYGDTFDRPLTSKEMLTKYKDAITPCYVAQNLRISRKEVTPEIEKLAREKIFYHRKRDKELKSKTSEELIQEKRNYGKNFQSKYRKTSKCRNWRTNYYRKNKEQLTDSYVISCIHLPPGIKKFEVPIEIIETKRKYLKLLKDAKQAKENNSN